MQTMHKSKTSSHNTLTGNRKQLILCQKLVSLTPQWVVKITKFVLHQNFTLKRCKNLQFIASEPSKSWKLQYKKISYDMKIEKCIHVHQKDLLKHKTKNYINVIQLKESTVYRYTEMVVKIYIWNFMAKCHR